MIKTCQGCGDPISEEERRQGATNGYCVICEYIHPSTEERKERFTRMQTQRDEWNKAIQNRFQTTNQKTGKRK